MWRALADAGQAVGVAGGERRVVVRRDRRQLVVASVVEDDGRASEWTNADLIRVHLADDGEAAWTSE